jgi:hypothetical protein
LIGLFSISQVMVSLEAESECETVDKCTALKRLRILLELSLLHFGHTVHILLIKRAIVIFTLEHIELFSLFNFFKCFCAVRTLENHLFLKATLVIKKTLTHFALELSFSIKIFDNTF